MVGVRQGLDIEGYKAYLKEFYGSVEDEDSVFGTTGVSIEKKFAARQFLTTELQPQVPAGGKGTSSVPRHLMPMNLHFFRSLMQSWSLTGTLPPLSDEENTMLSSMYQIWSEHRRGVKLRYETELRKRLPPQPLYQASPLVAHRDAAIEGEYLPLPPDQTTKKSAPSAVNSLFGTARSSSHSTSPAAERVPVSSALAALKERIAAREEFKHVLPHLLPFIAQLDVLMRALEPVRSQARRLFRTLYTNDLTSCALPYLEKRAADAPKLLNQGDTSYAVMVACLFDFQCRHLGEEAAHRSRAAQLYMQAAGKADVIAAMQLAGACVRPTLQDQWQHPH